MNRRRVQCLAFLRCQIMIQRREYDAMTDQCTVINENTALILEFAAGIDKYMLSNRNIFSKVGIKRRKQTKPFVNRFSDQFRKQRLQFFRFMLLRVDLHRDFLCLTAVVPHQLNCLGIFPDRLALAEVFQKFL